LRFLSPEWFAAVRDAGRQKEEPDSSSVPTIVMGQVVRDTPFGEVSYKVEVRDGSATLIGPDDRRYSRGGAQTVAVTITSDWTTACALASGTITAERALIDAKLRVRGDLDVLGSVAARLRGVDPVPAEVRARTSFE
jgi:hypothetical protein